MGLFSRLVTAVRDFFVTPPEPPPQSAPPDERGDEPEFERPEQDLPPGWKFEGLYYTDRAPGDRKVINQNPSDSEIANADAIVVSYTDGLGTIHRTIHGAMDRKAVGRHITRVTIPNSPR